ncbi:permease [Alkalihalophilus marmarensis]|nr:permease [Alkalihalophilus marmarensis]
MRMQGQFIKVSGLLIVGMAVILLLLSGSFQASSLLVVSESILTFNMIFISILIEAIPFVLIGVFIAGIIQIFVTEEHLKKLIPKHKGLAVLTSCLLGALFPACECGIVPIVRRLIGKGVPLFAGVGFLLTGPLINPLVFISTYVAFGEDFKIATLRMGVGLVIAVIIAAIISVLFKNNQLKKSKDMLYVKTERSDQPFGKRLKAMLYHAVDEFFDMGKYLIIGALLAAFVQTYISTKSILGLGDGILLSTFVMMGLAFLLSLCSEADAFIAASFRHLFPDTSLLGFLIYGPMLDLKNTIMLMALFNVRFVFVLMVIITTTVLGTLLVIHPWL